MTNLWFGWTIWSGRKLWPPLLSAPFPHIILGIVHVPIPFLTHVYTLAGVDHRHFSVHGFLNVRYISFHAYNADHKMT